MNTIRVLLSLLLCPTAVGAQPTLPIIDMHLHVRKADYMGPEPPPMCTPFSGMPLWDNRQPIEDGLAFSSPPCANPIPAETSDEQVMRDTFAVMEKLNIIGMVSGEPHLVSRSKTAAPERIIVATPVISKESLDLLSQRVDQVVFLNVPDWFEAVSNFYRHFRPVSDTEVLRCLDCVHGRTSPCAA